MNKKEIKIVISLACTAVLLAIALFAVTVYEEKSAAPEYLLTVKSEDIVKLDFANGEDYVHLEKSGSLWKMSDDDSFPVDQNSIEKLISALIKTKVESTVSVKSQTDLNNYSLLSPQCIIEYAESSGKVHSVRVGIMNSLTESLYISLDEDINTVYITSNPIAQAFSCKKMDLMAFPDIPTPSSGHLAVTVKNIYGTAELFKDEDIWYIYTPEGAQAIDDKTAYNYYYLTWDMHWRGAVENNAEDLSKYDLARPRISYTLSYEENNEIKTFDLELGSSLPDGKCYAKMKGSNDIYLLDSLMADWLESTKTEDLYELQK